MLGLELGSGLNTWKTGGKNNWDERTLLTGGGYSSLAKFFPNLLFNNSFNMSIAKIKPSLRSFGEGGGGCKYLQ